MSRTHGTHRQPRNGIKWALVVILVPFLLVGCVTLEKARDWFGVATEVCHVANKIMERCHDRK